MLLTNYKLFYDKSGKLTSIYDEFGRQLVFDPESKTFEESDPLTKTLGLREAEAGQQLDISDRPVEPPDLAEAIAQKQAEIIEAAYEAQNELVAGYAPAEQASWDKKLVEAEAILSSTNIEDAPVLKEEAIIFTGAATETDILNATLFLAGEIKTKSQQLYVASAQIAGKRTLLWNQAENAETVEELEQIVW